MFSGSESAARSHVAADLGREGEKSAGTANVADGSTPAKTPGAALGTKAGATDLAVPLVQMNALLGFVADDVRQGGFD